jgi:hypothetical protein
MSEGLTPGIEQFHARLFSAGDSSKLMTALRRLSLADNARQLTASAGELEGWLIWYSQPEEDGKPAAA